MKYKTAAQADAIAQKLMVQLTLDGVPYGRFMSDKPLDINYTKWFQKINPKSWKKWLKYLEAQEAYKQLKREGK